MSAWARGLFEPESVAIIGASDQPDSLGRLFVQNLVASYRGELYLVHPSRRTIANRTAYPSLGDTPRAIDLAVILVPPQAVEGVIDACIARSVRAAVIISGGFAETGPQGVRLQQRIADKARAAGLRLVGPNCFGIINTANGLNASLGLGLPAPGGVSLVTQSGAYGMAAFTCSQQGEIGFAKVLALGNRSDINEVEALRFLGEDLETRVIAMLLESVSDGRAFYQAACETTARKPVIVLKTGRTRSAQRAAASHTAALADEYAITAAALRQAGMRLVEDGRSLLDVAAALDQQPPLQGRRVGIITNSGGVGVELTDLLEEHGLEVPPLSSALQDRLTRHLPAYGSATNPIDVTTDWPRFPEMYGASLRALLASEEVDAVIAVLLHRSALAPEVGAALIAEWKQARRSGCGKPLHVCWVAGREAEGNRECLVRAGVPCHTWTRNTASTLAHCLEPQRHPMVEGPAQGLPRPRSLTEDGWVATAELFGLLESAGLPVVPYRIVEDRQEAVAAATAVGFPVVVKGIRPGWVHKFKAGAVVLNLSGPEALAEALLQREGSLGPGPYLIQAQVGAGSEWLLGAIQDGDYGPVVLFGPGGVWAEALKDVTLRLAPFGEEEALSMITNIRCPQFLEGLGLSAPVDRQALARLLARLSTWVASMPGLRELDLNPVIFNAQGLHIVDARMRVATDRSMGSSETDACILS